MSKQLIDRTNTNLVSKLKLNQWKNTKSVLSWLNTIQHKDLYSFIAFDAYVVDFHPTIFIDFLSAALEFASRYDTISGNERHIILQAKNSLHPIFLTLPWVDTTELNDVNLSVHTSSTPSEKNVWGHLCFRLVQRWWSRCNQSNTKANWTYKERTVPHLQQVWSEKFGRG